MSNPVHYDSETKTWSGPSVPYPFGNASVGELIYDNLIANLSHVAQVSDVIWIQEIKLVHEFFRTID